MPDMSIPESHIARFREGHFVPGTKIDLSGDVVWDKLTLKTDTLTITGKTRLLFPWYLVKEEQDTCNAVLTKNLVFAPTADGSPSSLYIGSILDHEEWQRAYVGGSDGRNGRQGRPNWFRLTAPTPGKDADQAQGRGGGNGARGENGREGYNRALVFFYLYAERISGPWGAGITGQTTLVVDRVGYPGGNGGDGGRGGDAGKGERGTPSKGWGQGYVDCNAGPGDGGDSGRPGLGGSGAPGFKGGEGGWVFIFSNSDSTVDQLRSVTVMNGGGTGGVGGRAGFAGSLAPGGRGGDLNAPCSGGANDGQSLGPIGDPPTDGRNGETGHNGRTWVERHSAFASYF